MLARRFPVEKLHSRAFEGGADRSKIDARSLESGAVMPSIHGAPVPWASNTAPFTMLANA